MSLIEHCGTLQNVGERWMYDPAVLRFVLISGLVGFAVFCISSAVLVWRRRQTSARRRTGGGGTLRPVGTSLLVAGLLCLGVAVAVREVNRVEGMLSSKGLYAIRASDDDYQVTYLLEGTTVSQGTVIARFESPEAEAQVQELQLKCQRLIKQRAALQLEPLELDNELVRHHQNAITAVNQLRASVGQLLPEHESVVRQATMERLSRQEKIARLVVDISTSEGQLVQTRAHRVYLARELERAKRLNERSAVAQSEVDAWQKQLQDSDTSIENLQRQLQGLQDEKVQLQQSLAEIASLASQQRETLSAELQTSRHDCGEKQSQQQQLSDKLTQDVQRASRLRQHELEQLDLQVQECQAQLAGLNKTLTIQAPYDGTVVYRDPSPRSAQQLQPIFVLARQPGFRLEAMLPRRCVTALEQAERVTIELLHPAVERYFSGSYLRCRPLPERPGYVVAELACQPPEPAIRQLLEGEQIEARLAWRPPLLALPLVRKCTDGVHRAGVVARRPIEVGLAACGVARRRAASGTPSGTRIGIAGRWIRGRLRLGAA